MVRGWQPDAAPAGDSLLAGQDAESFRAGAEGSGGVQASLASLAAVAWHTVAIYLFLLVALRLAGGLLMGRMAVLDLLVIALIGSAVETSLIAGDVSLAAGLLSAALLLTANWLVGAATCRWAWLRRAVVGRPVLLVHNGQVLTHTVRRLGLTQANLEQAARAGGSATLDEVKFAVLEINGRITIVPREREARRGEA